MLTQVDWPTVAAALATFLATSLIAWKGWHDKKEQLSAAPSAPVQVLSATIQTSEAMLQNTERLRSLSEDVEGLREDIRANTAALTRHCDIMLLTHHHPS